MDEQRSLQTSFWLMVLIQTIGSVDMPGRGVRKMPAPRAYVAIIVTWGVLQLLADTGRERAAAMVGWVMVLAGLTVGPFGKTVANFFNSVATFAAPPSTQPGDLGVVSGNATVNQGIGTGP